ncbi:MAG: glycogen/starch/alpha-glucan phosphorylase [Candidatus Hydrogenedentales bacterium]
METSHASNEKQLAEHGAKTIRSLLSDIGRHGPLQAQYARLSYLVRSHIHDLLAASEARRREFKAKRICYLSMEHLPGRLMVQTLMNTGLVTDEWLRDALADSSGSLRDLLETEPEPALGNGGLARLASCMLESMATQNIPACAYGLRYEFGIFRQDIENGYQKECPAHWTANSPFLEFERIDQSVRIPLYGRVEEVCDASGEYAPRWVDCQYVIGVPHDIPIPGYDSETVNVLRLFRAQSSDEFDLPVNNDGDYFKALDQKIASENITKILFPSDCLATGRELRLVQEYFLAACAVRDIVRDYLEDYTTFDAFPSKVAMQLNDTHPALSVAELMRTLVDDHGLPWASAWDITRQTFNYTNHTLLPQALGKWPVPMFEKLLPRHLQIIYEINRRFLESVQASTPDDVDRIRRMSIIEEGEHRFVRLAHLAMVGSRTVNGVSRLHGDLIKSRLFPDFAGLWPQRFTSITNGVSPRRWLTQCNPRLHALICDAIGDSWTVEPERLADLAPFAEDTGFQRQFAAVKKERSELVKDMVHASNTQLVPGSMFDVQLKRIHEYKRHLLHLLYIIHKYVTIVEDGVMPAVHRTHIFAGKAAPGYWAAKQLIRFINCVAGVINSDVRCRDYLQIVFVPDYTVAWAERIIPATDVSEQLSLAGAEACGTTSIKMMMNGALTIGTRDGVIIEMAEAVGEENIFLFGNTYEGIEELRRSGNHNPRQMYEEDPLIRRVLDALRNGRFNPAEPGVFDWIFQSLVMGRDPFFNLADLASYLEAQERVNAAYADSAQWSAKCILNIAHSGRFSIDRSIREYADKVWKVPSSTYD